MFFFQILFIARFNFFFSYIFIWMIATLATNKNSFKKTLPLTDLTIFADPAT
jgi:hypothetical protein